MKTLQRFAIMLFTPSRSGKSMISVAGDEMFILPRLIYDQVVADNIISLGFEPDGSELELESADGSKKKVKTYRVAHESIRENPLKKAVANSRALHELQESNKDLEQEYQDIAKKYTQEAFAFLK